MTVSTDLTIIGAGPVGIFTVFAAGLLGIMNCQVLDSLSFPGGQCASLYPEKYIYDIPGLPKIKARDLIDNLLEQSARFIPQYHYEQVAERLEDHGDHFELTTSQGKIFHTKSIIIAGGSGIFTPRRPLLDNLEEYEGKSVFYAIDNYEKFRDKNIIIAGGGDSAIDFAIILAEFAKQIYLVHRRDNFRCAPASLEQIRELQNQSKLKLITPYQLYSLQGENGVMKSSTVENIQDRSLRKITADFLLPFFGLKMNLGPLAEWPITLTKQNQIEVTAPHYQTSRERIYAIGDIASYPGKLKLIATGFAEAMHACHDLRQKLDPERPLHRQHSTAMFTS